MRPRTRFDLLKPSFNKESKLKSDMAKIKLYSLNDTVFVKNKQTKLWQKGKIVKVMSHCTYLVQMNDIVKLVHANDIRIDPCNERNVVMSDRNISMPQNDNVPNSITTSIPIVYKNPTNDSLSPKLNVLPPNCTNKSEIKCEPINTSDVNSSDKTIEPPTPARTTRSGRVIKRPYKLNL